MIFWIIVKIIIIITKRGKKRLNVKLEHHMTELHTLPHEPCAIYNLEACAIHFEELASIILY